MRNQFDRQLNTLNGELIQMGHMVEQAIEHAIEAMVHQDAEKARKNMDVFIKYCCLFCSNYFTLLHTSIFLL